MKLTPIGEKLWLVIKREFRLLVTEDRLAALLFGGIPLIYVLLFGILYWEDTVNHIPIVIYDQDQTAVSRSLIQAFDDSRRFQVVAYASTQEEFEQYMREKKAQAGLAIPDDFSRRIKRGIISPVLFEANAANILFSNSAIAAAQEIVANVAAGIGQKLVEAGGPPPDDSLEKAVPFHIRLRVISNPTFSYTNFILAGLGANGLQIGIILVVGPLINKEYQRLRTRPETAGPLLLLGKILVYWLYGMVIFLAYTLISIKWFYLPYNGGIGQLLLIGSAYVFALATLGCLIGAIAPNPIMAAVIPLLYIMPALLFSGYIWPRMAMNTFSLIFSRLAPIAYIADNVRDLLLTGYAPHLFPDALVLYAAGVVLLIISLATFACRRSRILAVQGGQHEG